MILVQFGKIHFSFADGSAELTYVSLCIPGWSEINNLLWGHNIILFHSSLTPRRFWPSYRIQAQPLLLASCQACRCFPQPHFSIRSQPPLPKSTGTGVKQHGQLWTTLQGSRIAEISGLKSRSLLLSSSTLICLQLVRAWLDQSVHFVGSRGGRYGQKQEAAARLWTMVDAAV